MMNLNSILAEVSQVATEVITETPVADGGLTDLPLISKGLLTSGVGLLGVFLVLTLFLITIRLMQGIKSKDSDQ